MFFSDNDDSLSFSNTFQKKSADTLPSLPFLILHAFYTLEVKKCNHQFQSSLFFAKISKPCTSVQNVHDVIIKKEKKLMAEFNALIRSNYSTKSCFFSQHDDELFSLSVKLLLA